MKIDGAGGGTGTIGPGGGARERVKREWAAAAALAVVSLAVGWQLVGSDRSSQQGAVLGQLQTSPSVVNERLSFGRTRALASGAALTAGQDLQVVGNALVTLPAAGTREAHPRAGPAGGGTPTQHTAQAPGIPSGRGGTPPFTPPSLTTFPAHETRPITSFPSSA